MRLSLLAGLRVVEVAGNPGARHCGRMFAMLGAEVTRIATGDAPGVGESMRSFAGAYFDRHKRVVASAPEALRAADVVIGTGVEQWLARPVDGLLDDRLVVVDVPDFEPAGPYGRWKATSLIHMAASGWLSTYGDPDRPPMRTTEFQPYIQAGLHAFAGAMAALLERRRSGRGQLVRAAVTTALAAHHEWTTVRYTHGGIIQRRVGNRYAVYHPYSMYPAKDGWMTIGIFEEEPLNLILALTGHPEAVGDPRFADPLACSDHAAEFDALIAPWMAERTCEELLREFEALNIIAGSVHSLGEFLGFPYFVERGFWDGTAVDGRPIRLPGASARHREGPQAGAPLHWRPLNAGPLAGLRVLDLTRHWAGPIGARALGDLGADVIRIEPTWMRGTVAPSRQLVEVAGFYRDRDPGEDYWNRSGYYNTFNYNKRNLVLRMDRPEGLAAFQRLVAIADVVFDNYATRTWRQFGIDPDSLWAINPGVVAVTMPGWGRDGEFRNRGSYGPQCEALIGAASVMGYPDRGPHMAGMAWPDPGAGLHATGLALAAVWAREVTGRGQAIETAQVEATATFLGPEYVEAQVAGQPPRPGNRHRDFAPHGVFRCAGDDRWLAVAVTTDAEWRSFCAAIGRRDLDRPEHARLAGRQRAEDQIDAAIAEWAALQSPIPAMQTLQAAGVPAFAVYDTRDLVDDPATWEAGVLRVIGDEVLPGTFVHLSRTPAGVYRATATMGEHNAEVLREAGLDDLEIEALAGAGVIRTSPAL